MVKGWSHDKKTKSNNIIYIHKTIGWTIETIENPQSQRSNINHMLLIL